MYSNAANMPNASEIFRLPGGFATPTVLPGVTPEWLQQNMGANLFQPTPFGYFDRATNKIVPYAPQMMGPQSFQPGGGAPPGQVPGGVPLDANGYPIGGDPGGVNGA
jgi:hypothetical protein